MPKKQRFEFEEGKSSKFWEIEVAGATQTVRFGRIGTEGQTKTKEFSSAAEAQQASDKLIQQKTGKGYREVSATAAAKASTKAPAKAPAKKSKSTTSVSATWQRIEAWLAKNAPEQAKSLAKGATDKQIQELHAQLGMTLPDDFIESCSLHDGQKEDCDLIPDDYGSFYLLRAKDIPKERKIWNQLHDAGEFEDQPSTPDKGVAADWWNPAWIPFASNGGGDHLCIDLAPAKGGKVGQIICMRHDESDRKLLAPSFAAWLGQLAAALEGGELDMFLE